MLNKNSKTSIDKKEGVYSTKSFTVYIQTRNSNFSTSAYSSNSRSDENTYQVLNKVVERKIYATKRR